MLLKRKRTAESGPFDDLPLEEPYADESEMSTARRRRSVKHGTLPEMAVIDEPQNETTEQPASSIPKGARPLSERMAAADANSGSKGGGKGLAIVLLLLLVVNLVPTPGCILSSRKKPNGQTPIIAITAEVDGRKQDNADWDKKYNGTVSEMTGQYNALEESKKKVETEFAETKQALETQLDGVKNTLGDTTAKLKKTTNDLADKIAEATNLTTQLDTTKASLTESVAKVGTLEEQVKRLDQGGRAMEAKLKTAMDERNKAATERDALQKQLEDIKAKLKEKGIGGLLNKAISKLTRAWRSRFFSLARRHDRRNSPAISREWQRRQWEKAQARRCVQVLRWLLSTPHAFAINAVELLNFLRKTLRHPRRVFHYKDSMSASLQPNK